MSTAPAIQIPDDDAVDYGEVFTRRWVVDLILDLAGYTSDRDLVDLVAVEPSCGSGAFLGPMVERLTQSAEIHQRPISEAQGSIVACDLLAEHVETSRRLVMDHLGAAGVDPFEAADLANSWVSRRDFLLDPPAPESADFVVGNPPYIRMEAVPKERSAAYRAACPTMGGRADVYVGFYEHGLRSLRSGGKLGFICADRWMRNSYGARLRKFVSEGYAVEEVIGMTGVDAFEAEVDAYPAVTVLSAGIQDAGPLVVETHETFTEADAARIPAIADTALIGEAVVAERFTAARMPSWPSGTEGWPNGSPVAVAVVAQLEASFDPLQNPATGTMVGIGVATGSDKVFITKDSDLVEADRLLPLAMPSDISTGSVNWSGRYLVNPWVPSGIADLEDFPRLGEYFGRFEEALGKRHTAKRGNWYRTIDRVINGLTEKPKLYLPDFKDVMFPVLDEGNTYPHHNIYWVTSEVWDLRVLGGLLMSDVSNLFIRTYSVRMRGGFYRFQAQYLRRIRLPAPESIGEDEADALRDAFVRRDSARATEVALPLYGLDDLPD